MKEAPIPKITTFSFNLQNNDKNYKLDLNQNDNYLKISCSELNSINPNIFSAEYSKNSLEMVSKYFLLFDNIEDSLPELISKIKKNEISINVNENIFQLSININIINFKNVTFKLYKKENNLDLAVQTLREENQKLKNEFNTKINELEKEIKEIKEKLLPLKEEKDKEEKENNFPNSKIIKNIEDKQLILNWIRPNVKIKLTLLYQVSQDGDRISTFYSKVSNKSPTLILVKTNAGFKFGGYTTNTWTNTNGYKKDELAFLFSIDKKKKYQINKDKINNAILTYSNRFAFGGGNDFCVFDQIKTNNSHYCNFPHSYLGGDKYELTGGQYNYLISECEVYHVEFI